jgi:2-oxoisovalerate dehydrogenase E1 component alpha subunit
LCRHPPLIHPAQARSPIIRFGRYLHARGLWSADDEDATRQRARREAIDALMVAEKEEKPETDHLFSDVLDEPTWMVEEQRAQLRDHLRRYASHYEHVES